MLNSFENIDFFLKDLPDPDAGRRFMEQLEERAATEARKLLKNSGLLSDVLTLASYSPLLSATLLQNPEYISWLNRQRKEVSTRTREELLESLARFSFTHTGLPPQVMLARFRRRELLRIYLRDIRRLGTIADITEEISNLADTILEYALRHASQEMDNRYGQPLESDEKGRSRPAAFCIISLGKLGSKELNYSSDIDLLFIYSVEGATSGQGTRGSVSNREYFIKLSELIVKTVGEQTGEGAAYRVDLRLRPHGRVGAIAISLPEVIAYYQKSAQAWEKQTLIRARPSAGDGELFKQFYARVEPIVYSKNETVSNALRNVRLSKEKINREHDTDRGLNVKLGRGGIREIEFIAQALQLAFGGNDQWLRQPHTLISLSRLSDRELIRDQELTALSEAYDFLRRLEHHLQMENGLQTHLLPNENSKRRLIARFMGYSQIIDFERALISHTANVSDVYRRVLGDKTETSFEQESLQSIHITNPGDISAPNEVSKSYRNIVASLAKSDINIGIGDDKAEVIRQLTERSPYFSETISANPGLIEYIPLPDDVPLEKDYQSLLLNKVASSTDLREALSVMRKEWSKLMIEIACFDIFGKITISESKKLQTSLAGASIEAALFAANREFKTSDAGLAILALGKMGGRGMDYGSDIDMILAFDDGVNSEISGMPLSEFYAKYAETFVSCLSSFTRDGYLYRVDLRLRPDGKNGALASGKNTLYEYLENRAAIWEYLAYIKLRGLHDKTGLAQEVEQNARKIIHRKASKIPVAELKNETLRVRSLLEKEKTRSAKDFDIKYSSGGMLDVYFSMRFLQLRDNIPDEPDNRSTGFMLKRLADAGAIDNATFEILVQSYSFLSELDHNLRLTVGRSTRLPLANPKILQLITDRMKLNSTNTLIETLTLHRINIRNAYEAILK